jgi:UDP-glucose 4-epimerase
MPDNKAKLKMLFKEMLEDVDLLLEQKDEFLLKDLEDYNIRIQWCINGIKGYQLFENGNYIHGFGKEIENADLTLNFTDMDLTERFLNNELEEYHYVYYKRKFKLYFPESRETIERKTGPVIVKNLKLLLTARFTNGKFHHPFILSKIPIFRRILEKFYIPENTVGAYIPINTVLGEYDNQILPLKLIDYFINKTNNIYVQYTCDCRVHNSCQDHEKTIGCMYLGEDVANLKHPPEKGRFITRKEALEYVRHAIDNGLVPTFGRYPFESTSMSVEDTGHFMSMCFCCPCCCINGKLMQNASNELKDLFKRMEGLTVKVDPEKCVGCGTCLDVCCFVGRDIVGGKAVIDQERCLGCGRCERVCPNDAISITLDNPERLEEFIRRIEEKVDVT